MNTHPHFGDQNELPGHQDPDQPQQNPDMTPGKEAPGAEPRVPGDPNNPGNPDRDRQPAPGEPGQMPPPNM